MFDIGFLELCLIGVVALLVVGPERLPRLARTAGMWVGRARRFMSEVKTDISAELREQDLASLRDIKQDLQQARSELEETTSELNQGLSDDAIMEEIRRPAETTSSKPSTADSAGKTARRATARKPAKKVKKRPSGTRKTAKKTSTRVRKKVAAKKAPGKKTGARKTKIAQSAGARKK